MSMSWQEINEAAYELSVLERLELIDAIVKSVTDEIRANPPAPKPKAKMQVSCRDTASSNHIGHSQILIMPCPYKNVRH